MLKSMYDHLSTIHAVSEWCSDLVITNIKATVIISTYHLCNWYSVGKELETPLAPC